MSKITTDKLCDGSWVCYDADQYDGAPDAGPQDVGYGNTEEESRIAFYEGRAEREATRDCNRAIANTKVIDGMLGKLFDR